VKIWLKITINAAKSPKKFCHNLWRSIVMAVEKHGKLEEEFFFTYFVATLILLNM